MFQGFSDAAIDFMWGIRFNNEKAWFEAHKQEYLTYFYRPMQQLGQQLWQRLDGAHPELGLICKVSRIYRDARRLHGRGPYKDHLWLCIRAPGERWHDAPVFWFELGPERWSYGLGYYCAQAATMAKLRARMDKEPRQAEALLAILDGQREFVLEGPSYARPKPAPTPKLAQWYNKKSFSFSHEEDNSPVLYDGALADRLCAGYELLLPLLRYLGPVSGDPDPRHPG